MEATQVPRNRQMDEEDMIYIYMYTHTNTHNGILLSRKMNETLTFVAM